MFKLFSKNGCFGVIDKGQEFVPPVYDNPMETILEWKYFELKNNKRESYRKFLPKNRTFEEIKINKLHLLSQIITILKQK